MSQPAQNLRAASTASSNPSASIGRPLFLALVLAVGLAGCGSTPDTSITATPDAEWHPKLGEQLAILSLVEGEREAPECARETLRRHLPDGPDLDPAVYGATVTGWLNESPPVITLAQLQSIGAAGGEAVESLDPHLAYLAVIRGLSEHDTDNSVADGADVIIVVRVPHNTVIRVDVFELENGNLLQRIRASSQGDRYYGLAGVFPIFVYSDTAGSACEALHLTIAEVIEETPISVRSQDPGEALNVQDAAPVSTEDQLEESNDDQGLEELPNPNGQTSEASLEIRTYLEDEEEKLRRALFGYARTHKLISSNSRYGEFKLFEANVLDVEGNQVLLQLVYSSKTTWNPNWFDKQFVVRWNGRDLVFIEHI